MPIVKWRPVDLDSEFTISLSNLARIPLMGLQNYGSDTRIINRLRSFVRRKFYFDHTYFVWEPPATFLYMTTVAGMEGKQTVRTVV
jgi:hypothetical protein